MVGPPCEGELPLPSLLRVEPRWVMIKPPPAYSLFTLQKRFGTAAILSAVSYLVAAALRPDLRPILYGASFFSFLTLPYTIAVCKYRVSFPPSQLMNVSTSKQCCPSIKKSSKLPAMLPSPTPKVLNRDSSTNSLVNG